MIAEIRPEHYEEWDSFVENHPFGWITHLSGWRVILETCFHRMRSHYLVEKNQEGIKAGLPLFLVKSAVRGKRLLSIPFATLSDPLVSSREEFLELMDAATRLSAQLNASSIEIRAFQSRDLVCNGEDSVDSSFKHHSLVLDRGPDELKKTFHRSCVRQRIARAEASGLVLAFAEHERDLLDFYRLYADTRKRLGLPSQPYTFFRALWNVFAPQGRLSVLFASQGGAKLGALLCLKFKERVSAECIGWSRDHADLSPNHFLFWEAIKMASAEGYGTFDFGRTSILNQPLMDFKTRWGTKVSDLPVLHYPKRRSEPAKAREQGFSYRFARKLYEMSPPWVYNLLSDAYYYIGG